MSIQSEQTREGRGGGGFKRRAIEVGVVVMVPRIRVLRHTSYVRSVQHGESIRSTRFNDSMFGPHVGVRSSRIIERPSQYTI